MEVIKYFAWISITFLSLVGASALFLWFLIDKTTNKKKKTSKKAI